mgnify:CR=1 FL=1
MKKVIITLLLGFLFFIPNVYAKEDVTLSNWTYENQVMVDIKFNSDIKGLTGEFEYDKKNLELVSCVSESNYNVQLKNNIIVIDNYAFIKDETIARCTFKMKNTDDSEHNITLNKISLSINEKLTGSDKSVTSYKAAMTFGVANRKNILLGIVLVIIVVLIAYLLINKRFQRIAIILLLLSPSAIKAVNLNNDDISNYRSILLSNNANYFENLDLDSDNKITINDLVLARIKISQPVPVFIEKVSTGNNEYKTSLVKTIQVSNSNNLVKAMYCITNDKECEPDKEVNVVGNSFDIKFENNILKQRICVYVEGENGLSNEVCDSKAYKVDNSTPTIKVIKTNLGHNLDTKFDPYSNIKVSFGNIVGKTVCTESLKYGKNTISCEAISANGNNAKATFIVNATYTYNKSVVFYGDSITYGRPPYNSGLSNYSWATYIKDNYDLKNVSNRGKSGWTVSNINGTAIYKLVEQDKNKKFDYVILHGGLNDVYYRAQLGSYDPNDFSGNYNTGTFIGGLETYLYKVTKTWPKAKIGYIINYKLIQRNNIEKRKEIIEME